MRRNIKKTTPTLVGQKRRDSGGQIVSPTGTPRAGATAATPVVAVVATPLSAAPRGRPASPRAASDRVDPPKLPVQPAASDAEAEAKAGAGTGARYPAETAGEGSLTSELDELLTADDVDTDPLPPESPHSYMTPTITSSTGDGITPQQMEFARASFLSSNSSPETEYNTPASSLHMAYVPGSEGHDKLPSPVRPQRGAQVGEPRLGIDQSIEVSSTEQTIPRTPSNQLPSPVGRYSIQHTDPRGDDTLQPLLLSPVATGDATRAAGQEDTLDSMAFCIAPCIDCLDLLSATGTAALGVVQHVTSLGACPCESLMWLVLLLALACSFLLPAALGFLGRRSQRHRWMLSCSSLTSVFLAAFAIAGSAVVLAETHAAATSLQDALARHCSGCQSESSGDGDGATSNLLQRTVMAGGLVAMSGLVWLARGVAGCVISRHLHRVDRSDSSRSRWMDQTTKQDVDNQRRATATDAAAAGTEFDAQRQSGRELRMMFS